MRLSLRENGNINLLWFLSLGVLGVMVCLLFFFNPTFILIGFFLVVLLIASLENRVRLYILIALLPFAHAGFGIEGFGGFGVYDIFSIWCILLYLYHFTFIDHFPVKLPGSLWFVVGMFLVFIPSVINSISMFATFKSFIHLAVCFFVTAAVYDGIIRRQESNFAVGLLVLLVIEAAGVSLYGIVQAYSSSSLANVISGRAYFSFFGEVNYYAGYLLMALSLALGFSIIPMGRFKKTGVFLVSIILASAVISTVSRSAFVVLGIIVLIYAVYFLFQGGSHKFVSIGVLSGVVGLVFLLVFTDVGKNVVDLFTLSRRIETFVSGHDPSIEQRSTIFDIGLRMAKAHPLIGIGFGTFEDTFNGYQGGNLGTGSARSAHNTALRILVETGILGLVVSLGFIVSLFRFLLRVFRHNAVNDQKKIIFSVVVALGSFLCMSLTLDQLFEPHFWLICGIGLAYTNLVTEKGNSVL
jgi:O-antigen ligase